MGVTLKETRKRNEKIENNGYLLITSRNWSLRSFSQVYNLVPHTTNVVYEVVSSVVEEVYVIERCAPFKLDRKN